MDPLKEKNTIDPVAPNEPSTSVNTSVAEEDKENGFKSKIPSESVSFVSAESIPQEQCQMVEYVPVIQSLWNVPGKTSLPPEDPIQMSPMQFPPLVNFAASVDSGLVGRGLKEFNPDVSPASAAGIIKVPTVISPYSSTIFTTSEDISDSSDEHEDSSSRPSTSKVQPTVKKRPEARNVPLARNVRLPHNVPLPPDVISQVSSTVSFVSTISSTPSFITDEHTEPPSAGSTSSIETGVNVLQDTSGETYARRSVLKEFDPFFESPQPVKQYKEIVLESKQTDSDSEYLSCLSTHAEIAPRQEFYYGSEELPFLGSDTSADVVSLDTEEFSELFEGGAEFGHFSEIPLDEPVFQQRFVEEFPEPLRPHILEPILEINSSEELVTSLNVPLVPEVPIQSVEPLELVQDEKLIEKKGAHESDNLSETSPITEKEIIKKSPDVSLVESRIEEKGDKELAGSSKVLTVDQLAGKKVDTIFLSPCNTSSDTTFFDATSEILIGDDSNETVFDSLQQQQRSEFIKPTTQNESDKLKIKLETLSISDTSLDWKKRAMDFSEDIIKLQQENSDLKIQLNGMQQNKASLELEIRQKEEIIIKAQAELLKNEQMWKLEIKKLKEELKENSKLIDKDSSKELEEQLKAAKARESKALADINQKQKDIGNFQKIMEEYENQFTVKTAEYQTLKEEYETVKRHLANLELAFSDVHSKYEKTKEVLLNMKHNEEVLIENLSLAQQTNTTHEERYESLKAHAKAQIEKSNKDLLALRDKYEADITKWKASVKRLEIKCNSLEVALNQKVAECEQLAALCDEITEKNT